MMSTVNEGRVLACLRSSAAPMSVQGFRSQSHLSVRVIRKTLAALVRSGLVEQAAVAPEPSWQLSGRARRWLETPIGRATLDVPAVDPAPVDPSVDLRAS